MITLGSVMRKIGRVNYYSNLNKEERKMLKLLIEDGLARQINRGRGKNILVELTQKGLMILEISPKN